MRIDLMVLSLHVFNLMVEAAVAAWTWEAEAFHHLVAVEVGVASTFEEQAYQQEVVVASPCQPAEGGSYLVEVDALGLGACTGVAMACGMA